MLVPPLISSPVFQRGTEEYATPGATTSGLSTSPPRELNHASTSRAGGTPGCGARENTPGYTAPTDRAKSADPGKPIVESPGPSLPALIANTTSGWAVRKTLTSESITARPSCSLPTPKLMLSTSGRLRCAAKRVAYSMARTIEPLTEIPPRALLAIFSAISCAPGATPSNPWTLYRLCPAAMPATCVPWPEVSNTRSSSGAPALSVKLAAMVSGRRPSAIVSRPCR